MLIISSNRLQHVQQTSYLVHSSTKGCWLLLTYACSLLYSKVRRCILARPTQYYRRFIHQNLVYKTFVMIVAFSYSSSPYTDVHNYGSYNRMRTLWWRAPASRLEVAGPSALGSSVHGNTRVHNTEEGRGRKCEQHHRRVAGRQLRRLWDVAQLLQVQNWSFRVLFRSYIILPSTGQLRSYEVKRELI